MSHPRITAAEAHAKMVEEGYAYVDVRTEDEVEAGHPEGAYNVPVRVRTDLGMEPNADFVQVIDAAFGKEGKLIVGCKAGPRSLVAAQLLTAAGFTNVLEQRAGYAGARDAFGTLVDKGWQ